VIDQGLLVETTAVLEDVNEREPTFLVAVGTTGKIRLLLVRFDVAVEIDNGK
jgi:hypothetical protein